jgi:threonine dehydratase
MVDATAIAKAREAIDAVFLDSPQFVSEGLGGAVSFRPLLKVETLNPVRSFKGRGGSLLAARAARDEVLVCASAGNFGQGIAYGARAHGLRSVVFAARDANPAKLDRIRALGAEVRLVHGDFDGAKEEAEATAAREGWRLVVDGREPDVAIGAGTMAAELTAGRDPVDAVVIPVGNGALAWGVSTWFKAHHPATRVIAVGPEGAPMMERAWRTGSLEPMGPTATIADGLAARVPVPEAVAGLRANVDDFVLVGDEAIVAAARLLLDLAGVLSEPSGAAGLAGAIALGDGLRGATVALPICGSNVPAGLLGRLVA